MSEEASGAASGYTLFEHDSGVLSVEVPSEWGEQIIVDTEGEKGRSSWSSFLDEGESAGPSIMAVNNLFSWRNGTPGHQGVYMVGPGNLVQRYTDDELVALGPNDYFSSSEAGTPRDFDRSPYSGRMLRWENCGGDSGHTATTLSAAPEDRECVVVAQISGTSRPRPTRRTSSTSWVPSRPTAIVSNKTEDRNWCIEIIAAGETTPRLLGVNAALCGVARRVRSRPFAYNAFSHGTNLMEDG